MGFFGSSSGSYKSRSYNPASYAVPVSMPSVSTNTVVPKSERPKEAQMADLEGYYETERRRRERNGVRGTFTVGSDEV